jgi:hypothetical protein
MSKLLHFRTFIGFTILCFLISWNSIYSQNNVNIYGYFSTRYEKSFNIPDWNGKEIENISSPAEFSYPFLNIMMQSQISDQFRVFLNLNGAKGATLDMKNFWGEYSPYNYLNIRVGKIYRKFGLYNEILDAVPSYYGIEAPEMFDADHLFISRTTMAMIYGNVAVGPGTLNYAISTDNGEGKDIFEKAVPIGLDLNYNLINDLGNFTLGTSYYTSGGVTNSDVDIAKGSPKSGVLPWMEKDSFSVFNGYFELKTGALTFQFEYAKADHKALRNLTNLKSVVDKAGINDSQRKRFLINPDSAATLSNLNSIGDYIASTWYTRIGYSFETSFGEIAPYFQFDNFSNPELIASKTYGGDDEAGVADDGKFTKLTGGVVFRPNSQVALKLDASSHNYKYHGKDVSYPEVRLDLSYTFGL